MNKKQLWDSILQQAISGKLVPQLVVLSQSPFIGINIGIEERT